MPSLASLQQSSKKIIKDCCLPNGGIVATNPSFSYYHKNAKNYFFIWPRDAAFACMGASIVKINTIQEPFFTWIAERAEGIKDDGLLLEKYDANGLQTIGHHRFQADQNGSVLYALGDWIQKNPKKKRTWLPLVKILANGLLSVWEKDHFKIPTNDLWEERMTNPKHKENFSYTLASCARGMLTAGKLCSEKKYEQIGNQMKETLIQAIQKKGFIPKSIGNKNDDRIDASALGVIWPFEIISPNDPVAKKTIELIEKKITKKNGVYRYEHDVYDGWISLGKEMNKGAGTWPLLSFWMSIVLEKAGESKKAEQYFLSPLKKLKTSYIPEQQFENTKQISVSPLLWSHIMFLFASKILKNKKHYFSKFSKNF